MQRVDTETVCETVSRPTTAVADTTVDAVNASHCHGNHDNTN